MHLVEELLLPASTGDQFLLALFDCGRQSAKPLFTGFRLLLSYGVRLLFLVQTCSRRRHPLLGFCPKIAVQRMKSRCKLLHQALLVGRASRLAFQLTAAFWLEPEKITSSSRRARTLRAACSPSTQRMDSATLLLPEPFGPMIAVRPEPNSKPVLVRKLLNPSSSRRFRYTSGRQIQE